MAIVPLNAFASNIVDSIELTVDAQPGMNLYNYEEYITINTPGLTFSDEFYALLETLTDFPKTSQPTTGEIYDLLKKYPLKKKKRGM